MAAKVLAERKPAERAKLRELLRELVGRCESLAGVIGREEGEACSTR
jgi:hypothetical protein